VYPYPLLKELIPKEFAPLLDSNNEKERVGDKESNEKGEAWNESYP